MFLQIDKDYVYMKKMGFVWDKYLIIDLFKMKMYRIIVIILCIMEIVIKLLLTKLNFYIKWLNSIEIDW